MARDKRESGSLARDRRESGSLARDKRESGSLARDRRESGSLARDKRESGSLARDRDWQRGKQGTSREGRSKTSGRQEGGRSRTERRGRGEKNFWGGEKLAVKERGEKGTGEKDSQTLDSRGRSERSRETLRGTSGERSRRTVEVVREGRKRDREDSRSDRNELERRKRVNEVRRKVEVRRKEEVRSSSSRESPEEEVAKRTKIAADVENNRDHKRIVLFNKKDENSEQRKHDDETNATELNDSDKEADMSKNEEALDLQLPEEELTFFESKDISPKSGKIGESGTTSEVNVGEADETASEEKSPSVVIEEETIHEGEATEEEAVDGKEEYDCSLGKEEDSDEKKKLVEEINIEVTKVSADIAMKKEEIVVLTVSKAAPHRHVTSHPCPRWR